MREFVVSQTTSRNNIGAATIENRTNRRPDPDFKIGTFHVNALPPSADPLSATGAFTPSFLRGEIMVETGTGNEGDPQNSATGSTATIKATKESKECAEIRKRLLNDPQSRAILDDAFTRSQFGTPNVHEEGGLLGEVIDYGQPYQKDRRTDSRFTNPPNLAPTTLGTGFGPWAKGQIGKDSGVVNYTYWYHTHPFTEGDVVQGVVVGNPNHPSLIHGDADVSQQLALTGVVVSKTRIVVFGMFGEKCSFRR